MQKTPMILLSVAALVGGLALMEAGERLLTAGAFLILFAVVAAVYKRFQRSTTDVPWVCRATAAIAVTLGVLTMVTGFGHSAAVTAVALDESRWVPLTILRFTTGALLIYSGVMSVAIHRGLRDGRRWAVGVGAATCLLFWLYLFLLLPLSGTGGTVPPMFGMWTAYLLWLAASAFATSRRIVVAGSANGLVP